MDTDLSAAGIDELLALLEADPAALDDVIRDASVNVTPETDDDLHAYIHVHYGYRIPRVAVCPGHVAPFDAMADLFFMRFADVDQVWTGGRGSGKTLDLAIIEHMLLTHFGDTIVNVGAVEEQAQACYRYIQSFDSKPRFMQRLKRSIISRTEYKAAVNGQEGATLKIVPATPRAVNSPHPRVAVWDEFDQTPWDVYQEGLSMPITVNGRPPQTVMTSSLKYAYGPMIRTIDAAATGEKALRVQTWCAFEIVERCPPERHLDGEGCVSCPLAKACLDDVVDAKTGKAVKAPGPGRASRSDGFMPLDDVIKKYRTLDEDTWESQWMSRRPSVKGLVYPQWDDARHVVDFRKLYDLGSVNGIPNRCHPSYPVYGGIDFGFTNASVIIYLQVIDGKIIAFAEDYAEMRTAPEMADHILDAVRTPWYPQVKWFMGDPAAAGDRATLAKRGINISAADNTKDIAKDSSGISKVRWCLAPQGEQSGVAPVPLLYVDRACKMLISQLKTYHVAEDKDDKNTPETPVKSNDHAPDALRYAIARLIMTPGSKKTNT